jgi:hypothetical protein
MIKIDENGHEKKSYGTSIYVMDKTKNKKKPILCGFPDRVTSHSGTSFSITSKIKKITNVPILTIFQENAGALEQKRDIPNLLRQKELRAALTTS